MKLPVLTRGQWIGAACLVALLGLIAWGVSPRPIGVESVRVRKGSIVDAVTEQGVMRVREAFVVAAPVAGRLERLTLKVGDRVTGGETVARIRPMAADFLDPRSQAQARAAVAAAQAALAASQAEQRSAAARHELAKRELSRTQTLAERGIASRQALENAEAATRTARNAEQAARAQSQAHLADLAAARAAFTGPSVSADGALLVTAPARGVVTRVFHENEGPVSSGAPILEIGDRQGLEAAIEFLSQEAVKIREGQDAEIIDWGGPPLAATVRRIEPQAFTKVSALGVEEQRVLVLLQVNEKADSWSALGAGYRVWGRVILRRSNSASLVPIGSLVRQADKWAVFVVERGQARVRTLEIGAMNDQDAEVLKGLSPEEEVVVFPSDKVREGVRVRQTNRIASPNG